jgi:hypothetical protein
VKSVHESRIDDELLELFEGDQRTLAWIRAIKTVANQNVRATSLQIGAPNGDIVRRALRAARKLLSARAQRV